MSLKDKEQGTTSPMYFTAESKIFMSEDVKKTILDDMDDFEDIKCVIFDELSENEKLQKRIMNLLNTHKKLKEIRFGDFEK